MNIGTLFSGFGGVDIGAQAAGLDLAWGIEYDADIAEVARRNLGDHVITADILDIDPATMPPVDVLHASPPCPNFSIAKADRGETDADLALARKVAEFVVVLQPKIFTLENVYGYRKSDSWRIIANALDANGYWYDLAHVNAADFAVPQSRRRMIVRAVRGGFVPYLPPAVEHVGWYAAIEDILHTLPDSKFAPWQLDRLPDEVKQFVMGNGARSMPVDDAKPMGTITSNSNQLTTRALLVGGANRSKQFAEYARQNRPTMPGCKTDEKTSMQITATASSDMRALLIDTLNGSRESTKIDADRPSITVQGAHGHRPSSNLNAYIANGESMTGRNGAKATATAYADGRVVRITARALARFQTFPDWYELPKSNQLAAKGIGNAVPPLLYEQIIKQLMEAL